jgi:hypothetical protein
MPRQLPPGFARSSANPGSAVQAPQSGIRAATGRLVVVAIPCLPPFPSVGAARRVDALPARSGPQRASIAQPVCAFALVGQGGPTCALYLLGSTQQHHSVGLEWCFFWRARQAAGGRRPTGTKFWGSPDTKEHLRG